MDAFSTIKENGKRKRILGEEHIDTLESMSSLATVCLHQRKLDEAEQIEADALHRCKKAHGGEHQKTMEHMSNLAEILLD